VRERLSGQLPAACGSTKSASRHHRLGHSDHGQCFTIVQRDRYSLDFNVAFQPVERNAGQGRAHFELAKSSRLGCCFNMGEDQAT
jgi:hypothetical protein